uniref:VPS9 domain-containing protein n=1 Tax=Strongyloides papillosus TaxID=174720 RepID=A0A0N5BAV1_STREA
MIKNDLLWRKYFTLLEIIDNYSESTYDLWQNVTSLDQGIVKALKNDKRIHLYTINNPKLKDISVVSTNPLKNLIGRSWIKLIIFNDGISIIDKNDYIFLEFPLLWIIEKDTGENNNNDNNTFISIISPEYEFELDTNDVNIKNDLLKASTFWYNYSLFIKLLSYHKETGFFEIPPNIRFVTYKFSSSHQVFRNATYTGLWKNGKPHGKGTIVFPGGKRYKGNFINGLIEGYGKLQVPVDNTPSTTTAYFIQNVFFSSVELHPLSIEELKKKKYDYMEGNFKNGVLHGLAMIRFANGDTYRGYFKNGHREGFGINCQLSFGVGERMYCGNFKNDMKHGYGVYSTNHEKYLGMWENDLRHGKGCQITIDGVYHEGIFDKDRFIRGQMIYYCENLLTTTFSGDFDKEGITNGKGILHTSPFDYIEGYFQGNILSNELKISNGVYKRKDDVLLMDPILRLVSSVLDETIIDVNENVGDIGERWLGLFTHFLEDHFKIECSIEELESLQNIEKNEIWEIMLSSCKNIKQQLMRENNIINVNEEEEIVPEYNLPWDTKYYGMVDNYFKKSINLPYNPINRLVKGILEVFTFAYDKIGAHKCLYQQIVVELHIIIRRLYIIMRFLFPNLPSSENMYNIVGEIENDGDTNKTFDSEYNIPACNFIGNYFFIEGYAVLFTVFQMHCQEADQKYFERICFLNTFNDSKLSDMMGLSDYLKPSSTTINDTTLPYLEYYKTAIHIFQTLSGHCNPVKKLSILEETFDDILKVCFPSKFINIKNIYN